MPLATASKMKMLMTALPTTTKGCRALFDREVGMSTVSGSSAVRGLRGAMSWEFFAAPGEAPIPFAGRPAPESAG
jgi:hypothetical protein